ncbi:hypothetical protein PV327_008140 [Microctonus hyperodae]|uniref:Uncharacterized protein n=1 Tax=Microctonus hyperodae TaxID=165561 RepID=A0AA39F2I5_MICHY|nr:hypothetical protein PV327_008140 [Microctonus hyperodae]
MSDNSMMKTALESLNSLSIELIRIEDRIKVDEIENSASKDTEIAEILKNPKTYDENDTILKFIAMQKTIRGRFQISATIASSIPALYLVLFILFRIFLNHPNINTFGPDDAGQYTSNALLKIISCIW